MSSSSRKCGFVAAQPAATISTLDFAAASEAFAAARAMDGTAANAAQAATIADLIAERADRLIGIPTTDRRRIAEKVNAFLWLHGCTSGDLSEPATQERIAVSENEPAKCLLAIYLDLTGETEPTWDGAMARVLAVRARIGAWEAEGTEDDDRPFPSDLRDEHQAAQEAMVQATPPHWLALREKALLLRPFACQEIEDDYVIRADAGGVEGHLARLLEVTAEIGDCDPADAPGLLVLKACLYAEGIACAALTDKRSGYPAYAVNPRAISELSAIIGAIQEGARLLTHTVEHNGTYAIAFGEIWSFNEDRTIYPGAAAAA